jgi:ArsR family metal-binding transcriptional regulator
MVFMKIKYSKEADILLIELRDGPPVDSIDLKMVQGNGNSRLNVGVKRLRVLSKMDSELVDVMKSLMRVVTESQYYKPLALVFGRTPPIGQVLGRT